MATYEVEFATSAAKEFRSLVPELKHRIGAAIDGLSADPRPPGVRKLVGHERLYRIRVRTSATALGTAITINAHCFAMRLKRRLSTAFAAGGYPALCPNSLTCTSQMLGPLGTIRF